MKGVFAAIVAFLIGITLANALRYTPVDDTSFTIPVRSNHDGAPPVIDALPPPNEPVDRSTLSFFDSLDTEGYWSGWLVANEFRGMKEVWTILLTTDEDVSREKYPAWTALVLTENQDGTSNDDDDFHSVRINTHGDSLSFTTNTIRGIQYSFNGKFFKTGNIFDESEKVLTGTMIKTVRGKRVAKFTSDFAYHEPVCFH